MPGEHYKKGGRKHTQITSKKQRGLFGAELARRRVGKARRMAGITTTELENHLRESKGKKLPRLARMSRMRRRKRVA